MQRKWKQPNPERKWVENDPENGCSFWKKMPGKFEKKSLFE